MNVEGLRVKYYADPRFDGTRRFYEWIRRHVHAGSVVLNVGAGLTSLRRDVCLKGIAREVIGIDIDRDVLGNEDLDRAYVIERGRFPLQDESVDLAFADYVLEHVGNAEEFFSEVARVLKPGGCFFFRTPNRLHYTSCISALTPHSVHLLVANWARRLPPESHDPYPTVYRANTGRRIRALAHRAQLGPCELRWVECEPSYFAFHWLPFLIGVAYERFVNSWEGFGVLRSNIFGRIIKPDSRAGDGRSG